jgi:hypothetical protein
MMPAHKAHAWRTGVAAGVAQNPVEVVSARAAFSSRGAASKMAAFVASIIVRRVWVMQCQSVPFLVIGIGFLAAGCAGVNGVTSNDTGGIIPWTRENQQMAYSIASERCAQYDKYARITSVNAYPGDYIGFVCVWSPRARP